MEYIHPIYNLVVGRRLYYFLLSATSGAEEGERELLEFFDKEYIRSLHLRDRSCLYVVFGDADFALRVWLTETELHTLHAGLSNCKLIKVSLCMLCSRTSTWFQREIESETDWASRFEDLDLRVVADNVESLIEAGPADELTWIEEEQPEEFRNGENSIKILMLIREDRPERGVAYNVLDRKIRLKDKALEFCERISLYSAYCMIDGTRYTIMKFEARTFTIGSRGVRLIAKWLRDEIGGCRTTTYIVCESKWGADRAVAADTEHLGISLEEYARHFAMSVQTASVSKLESGDRNIKAFINIFCLAKESFAMIFWYPREDWNRNTSRVREIMRYVYRRDNDKLKGYILNDYIFFERQLRDGLAQAMNSLPANRKDYFTIKIINKGVEPSAQKRQKTVSDCSLGELTLLCPAILGEASKSSNETSEGWKYVVERFKAVSDDWTIDRNLLAHGDLTDLFMKSADFAKELQAGSKGKLRYEKRAHYYVWEFVLRTYFEIRHFVPRIRQILITKTN